MSHSIHEFLYVLMYIYRSVQQRQIQNPLKHARDNQQKKFCHVPLNKKQNQVKWNTKQNYKKVSYKI